MTVEPVIQLWQSAHTRGRGFGHTKDKLSQLQEPSKYHQIWQLAVYEAYHKASDHSCIIQEVVKRTYAEGVSRVSFRNFPKRGRN